MNEAPESRVAACTTGELIGAWASHTAIAVFCASSASDGDSAVEPGGDACVAPLHVPPAKLGAIVRFAVWMIWPVYSHRAVARPSGASASASEPVAPLPDSVLALAGASKAPPAGRRFASTVLLRRQAATASPAASIATRRLSGLTPPAAEIGVPAENSPAAPARVPATTCPPSSQMSTAAPLGATATRGASAAPVATVSIADRVPSGAMRTALTDVSASAQTTVAVPDASIPTLGGSAPTPAGESVAAGVKPPPGDRRLTSTE